MLLLAIALAAALAATVLLGWLLGLGLESVSGSSGAALDGPVTGELAERRDPVLTKIMKWVTWLGNRGVVLAAMALASASIWLVRKEEGPALFLASSVIGGYAASSVIKDLVHRMRPPGAIVHASGGSFPSGHALASVTLYGALAIVIWKMSARTLPRFSALGAAAFLVLAIAFSRVYLGVHWPSDVVGGAFLGAVWVTVCRLAWSRWERLGL